MCKQCAACHSEGTTPVRCSILQRHCMSLVATNGSEESLKTPLARDVTGDSSLAALVQNDMHTFDRWATIFIFSITSERLQVAPKSAPHSAPLSLFLLPPIENKSIFLLILWNAEQQVSGPIPFKLTIMSFWTKHSGVKNLQIMSLFVPTTEEILRPTASEWHARFSYLNSIGFRPYL